ncbi:hypothetical protein ACLXBB_37355, partial [Pseudomonas aeruginosa]
DSASSGKAQARQAPGTRSRHARRETRRASRRLWLTDSASSGKAQARQAPGTRSRHARRETRRASRRL